MNSQQMNIGAILGTNSPLTSYKNYVHEFLEAKGKQSNGNESMYALYNQPTLNEDGSIGTRTRAGMVFNKVVDMLNSTGFANGLPATFNDITAGSENYRINSVGKEDLEAQADKFFELCQDCNIDPQHYQYCMDSIGTALYRFSDSSRYKQHFDTSGIDNGSVRNFNTIYPAGVLADVTFKGAYTMASGGESFGLNTNNLLTDIKMSITLGLLKTMQGVTNRAVHRVANDTGAVQFIVPNDEYYNLAKSQAQTTEERQSWTHRAQLIQLLTDPTPIDMDLIPVIPLKDHDPAGEMLLGDGILLPGVTIPLYDLANNPTRIGYERSNYTDLLSNKMTIRGVHLKISDGTNTEYLFFETSMYPSATLVHAPNTFDDSGDYVATLVASLQLDRTTMVTPAALDDESAAVRSTILAALSTSTEYIGARLSFTAHCNIMSAITRGHGFLELRGITNTGSALSTTVTDLLDKLSVEIIGWEFDARYSEENYRKTNMAVRSMLDLYTYTLPDGRTIAYDSSMRQPDDEHMLDVAAKVQAIGFDQRNLALIQKTLASVSDRLIKEKSDPNFISNFGNQTVSRAFVSGRMINPEVHIGKIDLNNVVNIRTSDAFSDIREYIRMQLNTIVSRMNYSSLYLYNLDGKAPVFKVITTTPIIECLFSIPSIFPHYLPQGMNGEEIFDVKAPGKPTEYTTKLPNGTILQFVTTTFRHMDNKMIMIPFIEGNPSSIMNFAINYDGGQFTVNFNPVDVNEVNRRTLVNYREFPITLCPYGAIIEIIGLAKFFPNVDFSMGAYIPRTYSTN